jgi:hypothetical protein
MYNKTNNNNLKGVPGRGPKLTELFRQKVHHAAVAAVKAKHTHHHFVLLVALHVRWIV